MKNKKSKKRIIQTSILILFVVLCIALTIYLFPIIKRINTDDAYRDLFKEKIESFGMFGAVIIIFGFVVQTILAVIPAAPFEIMAGLLYGTWGGVIISLIGSTLGVLTVIGLIHLFGEEFAHKFVNLEDKKKFKFVDDPKRTGVIMFSILFMPGLPKDFVAFLVPFTKVKTRHFLIINLIARTPAIIVSALFGKSLFTGEFGFAIILLIISFIISIIGIVFNRQIVDLVNKIAHKKNK